MNNYAMVNSSTKIVENIIDWDGVSDYSPPDGYILVRIVDEYVNPGWIYDGDSLVPPPEPPDSTVLESIPNVIA